MEEKERGAAGRGPGWMYMSDLRWVEEHRGLAAGWYADGTLRRTPDSPTMFAEGPEAFLTGWLPAEPLIGPETRVIAFGSCFASRFAEWLAEHGFNLAFDSSSDQSIVRSPLETPSAVAQQFRWAFGELDSELAFWMTPDRTRVEATEEHRLALRDALVQADVIIITLGISELWFDTVSGEPIWRIPPRELQQRYAVKVSSTAESIAALETIHRIRLAHMPDLKILYTVSPQRLRATFRGISPIVANTVSKAILRVAVDEFLRAHPEELNAHYFYFPAYELATELLRDWLSPDNLHIRDKHAALILDVFARFYTTEVASDNGLRFPSSVEEELRETITGLEAYIMQLQAVCDERLAVIEHLDAERARSSSAVDVEETAGAALETRTSGLNAVFEEHLAVIEQLEAERTALQAACDERLAVIEQLDAERTALQAACDERLAVIERLVAERRRPFPLARAAARRLKRVAADRRRLGELRDRHSLRD
jgi:hypothetical protein